MKSAIITLTSLILSLNIYAQQADYDFTVRLTAEVSEENKSILLQWPQEKVIDYSLNRKDPASNAWGGLVANIDMAETSYLDENMEVGKLYEYRLVKDHANGQGFGYLYSGIKVAPIHDHGRLLLLVDDRFSSSLSEELSLLEEQIRSEGWEVDRMDVSMNENVPEVKAKIVEWYNSDPDRSQSVFLLGHIPVPYSGNIGPDGHDNHVGAWSADTYYGDVDGNWTDQIVNNTTGAQMRTHNVPGDGKFDNSVIPTDLELGVGRVDFYNLPLFQETEEELLRKYIFKNIAFRTKQFIPQQRALIENNFGSFGEGFGQNGLRNFSSLVGTENTSYMDYDNLLSESYIWSYGCGGGNYQGASGISNTNRLTTDSLQTVFTMLFGSYFGDWDSQNNFLRSALASGTVLTNAWAGRPNWYFHPMAMGYSIGYCARLSQNNGPLYNTGFGARFIHTALMGDPSLRMHIVRPPENLSITEINSHAELSWSAPDEDIYGYYIYRSDDGGRKYNLISSEMVTETTYTDSCLSLSKEYSYYVKTAKVEITPSGSYINLSPGTRKTISIKSDNSVYAEFDVEIDGAYYQTVNTSLNAERYLWDFGDGNFSEEENPSHFYTSPGPFTIALTAFNECNSSEYTLDVLITSLDENRIESVQVFPNPANDQFAVKGCEEAKLSVWDLQGKLWIDIDRYSGQSISSAQLPPGIYQIKISQNQRNKTLLLTRI